MASGDLISLHSDDGKALLADAATGKDGSVYQRRLHAIFAKQATGFTCGLNSCAMVMSSVAKTMSPPDGPPRYTEANMFEFPQTLRVKSGLSELKDGGGMTLDDIGALFRSHGCKVEVVHAAESTAARFRSDAVAALAAADPASGVVVNYKQDVLGQGVPYGHLSPLGAYHAPTDRLLVLDTWPETDECWAKADDLFVAMDTVDGASGKTRGYVVAHF